MTLVNTETGEVLAEREHFVYEIYSRASGLCIYVGMTCDLKRRLGEHARLRMWREPIFRSVAQSVPNRHAAEALEARRIGELQPTQNRRCTGSG